MASIYIIKNYCNNKVYIGQTVQPINIRFTSHIMASRVEDTKFYRAIRKYGEKQFYIELLETVPYEQLNERERYWIKQYDSYYHGYNSTFGGSDSNCINYDDVKQMWDQGFSRAEISNKLNLSRDTISKILRNVYGVASSDIIKRGYVTLMTTSYEDIKEKWEEGLTIHQISTTCGGDEGTIKKALLEMGITEKDIAQRRSENQMINSVENILKLWKDGLTITDITRYGGNRSTIRKVLLNNGITEKDINDRLRKHCNQNARPVVQLSLDDEYIATYKSCLAATKALGKNSSSINNCCNHKAKTAYGYKWMFLSEYNQTGEQ